METTIGLDDDPSPALTSTGRAPSNPEREAQRVRSDKPFIAAMVGPALIVVGLVVAFPLGYSLYTSFHSVRPGDLAMKFTGASNYRAIWNDRNFGIAAANTIRYAILSVAGTTVLGLGAALILNENFPGRAVMRTLLVLPWALSQILVAIIWGWMYDGTGGVINRVLTGVGLIDDNRGWLSDPRLALVAVSIAYMWSAFPFAALVLLSGLQTIPQDLYKAARVDGASTIRRFLHVTLPELRYPLIIVLIVISLEGLMAFSLIYMMTGGGPGTSTTVLAWMGYQRTFVNLDLGGGAAVYWALVAVMILLAGVYIRFLSTNERRRRAA